MGPTGPSDLGIGQRLARGSADPGGPYGVRFDAGTEARIEGRTVALDGDATQHQGFQSEDEHCRPPAID